MVHHSIELNKRIVDVGGIGIVTVERGKGRPLLMLHDELGFPGWMRWNEALADSHRFVIPMQPGFGQTPQVDWFTGMRDVASVYARMVRETGLGPIDVVGFSMGAWIAAEMAAADPALFGRIVLVAPLGIRPAEGDILDFLALTMRRHVTATISNQSADEVATMYGGGISPEQFELFEAARAESSRLAWEPYMHDCSLPHRLGGLKGPETLVVWGERDQVVPRGCAEAYAEAIPGARLEVIPGAGHRPELENRDRFVSIVSEFLATSGAEKSLVEAD